MTPESSGKWSDLWVRLGSGALMVTIGLLAIWYGSGLFHALVALVCGLMVWELVKMLNPSSGWAPSALGALAGAVTMASIYLPAGFALPILLAVGLLGFSQLQRHRTLFMVFTVMILMSGYGLMQVRDDLGFTWLLWIVLVVVVTDVVGYFAGRAIGGPKFWPRVSPKKTWSGTAAGWVGAAIVGWLFDLNTGAGPQIIGVSVAMSMASQMGDMAESALKRSRGIKDSSALIPGHGGLLDRFDGMLGASVFLLLAGQFTGFPFGAG
ncbi:phosphatidate cytidylyltransferase [Sulfitobacter sp. D35]|uniref:phosphatidate cytidylyltransferase n=1 Tax=Sulfitobacter sp. D35 TaxID=3083252 RepID=UPI00297001C3|nr:phosphatidate cytidylyltransferase [Sulfitobacter sp. D35]MDW4497733.1 phosphatidate cytidylyltransferase [Sulfitobacter sp. D35]